MEYAGFWRRLGALVVDTLVLLPLTGLALWGTGHSRLFYAYWLLPSLAFNLWFYVHLVRRYGGTPGKLALKMRIAMRDGAPVTVKAALLRNAPLFILSGLASVAAALACLQMDDTVYLSLDFLDRGKAMEKLMPAWYPAVFILLQLWIWAEFVTMLLNRQRRAVHDLIAGTVVIRQPAANAADAEQSVQA